jgi:leucine dehydrogenase
MESLFQQWEGETVIAHRDKPTGAWIFIAVYSTVLGPAAGGTRMKRYPDLRGALEDAMRLARGMAYKYALPDMPWGGGKAVIALPDEFDPGVRAGLLRRYGKLVHQLGGLFYTGPDMGTCSADMDIIAETGAPYIFACTPEAGGSGSSGPYTALGVFTGIQVACEHAFGDASLRTRKVLVQGTGSVGGHLIEYLRAAGARVAFSEVDPTAIGHYRDDLGLECVSGEEVYAYECDVFSPCALGGILNEETIPGLRCRIVAGGANNQLRDPADAGRLRARNILYAPDFVVNVGGAMAILGMETLGWDRDQAEQEVSSKVRQALRRLFALAAEKGMTTEEAAELIADERLKAGA